LLKAVIIDVNVPVGSNMNSLDDIENDFFPKQPPLGERFRNGTGVNNIVAIHK